MKSFNWASLVVRIILVFGIVFGTYNPSGYSYVHWITQSPSDFWLLKAFVGIGLILVYWVIVVATWLALGIFGLVFLFLFFATMIGALWQLGWLPSTPYTWQALILADVSLYLAIGVSYSAIRFRLTGQVQSKVLDGVL